LSHFNDYRPFFGISIISTAYRTEQRRDFHLQICTTLHIFCSVGSLPLEPREGAKRQCRITKITLDPHEEWGLGGLGIG
jgi:hypothetical protein